MTSIAIIGGTGLTKIADLSIVRREVHVSKFGEPSAPLVRGTLDGVEILFLPRHGSGHTIPPHKVNYRANISVLHGAGIKKVLAINAVGGISEEMDPQTIVVPDQIIDYTWSRAHTFFDEGLDEVTHIDFTKPYCEELRQEIIQAAAKSKIDVINAATYAATQGPRLETAAEINKLDNDGCHIVGMTGMPEAALASELGMCYASIAVVANKAAGRGDGEITMKEIEGNIKDGMGKVRAIIENLMQSVT